MFVPHHTVVPEPGPRTALVLHGILGSGRNWRSVAKSLAQRLPGWQFVLVDLRNHGDSVGAPGPHDLPSCAADLDALSDSLGVRPEVVMGHSFGGKVALEYAAGAPSGLKQVWVLDSLPFALPGGPGDDHDVLRVMRALEDVPLPLKRRNDVLDELGARGLSPMLQRWMTTNLRRVEGGFEWTFDLAAAQEMLDDYFERDYGFLLRGDGARVEVVRAANSDRWPEAWMQELRALDAHQAGRLHVLEDAGHWLHVDNPDGLLALLLEHWPA